MVSQIDSFKTVEKYSLPSNNRYHEDFLDCIPFSHNSHILEDSLSRQFPPWVFISSEMATILGPTIVILSNHIFKLLKVPRRWRSDPRYAMMTDTLLKVWDNSLEKLVRLS